MKKRWLLPLLALLSLCVAFAVYAHARRVDGGPVATPDVAEEPSGATADADYEETLFDASIVHRVDVRISEEDWDDLLENPTDKTKYEADVVVDGEELRDVSFATKGNSSLYFVAADEESSRYSFKINFGKYVDGQTYHGLDKLCLNNSFCDATYMKDHLSYALFRRAGVPAPLTSYVWLTVNGEDRGLYLAVEDYGDSSLERMFDGNGVIYKPESKDIGLSLDAVDEIKSEGLATTSVAHGSDFVYVDDDPESYPDIFENAETDPSEDDTQYVVAAMKCLSEGADPRSCLDTDEVIRFFAVHNFVLNLDSYTGSMLHNLVLHESDGTLSVLPWDYNLAFATFATGIGEEVLENPTDAVNQGIDSPLIGTTEDDRPLWKWIVRNEGFRKEYHDALDAQVVAYFESGAFEREYDELFELLLPYVEKDPTAFYSVDEYRKGYETMKRFCRLRSLSVRKQLSGELSSDSFEQDERDKVDASDVSVLDMGGFAMAQRASQ